jgi:hypothetical protein
MAFGGSVADLASTWTPATTSVYRPSAWAVMILSSVACGRATPCAAARGRSLSLDALPANGRQRADAEIRKRLLDTAFDVRCQDRV